MGSLERLIRYCKVDTQSDPNNEAVTPSTQKQFDLAHILVDELKALHLEDVEVDEHCYVYGWLPSNVDSQTKTIGLIAHMDTAPDFSGANVNPRVIENYDGKDIVLNDNLATHVDAFPYMKTLVGKTLVVTDGNSLLGADDKAGIVCIMEALSYLQEHPEVPHGRIAVCFTPDEEIGNGSKYFDIEKFGADFAYTMDGGPVAELSDETFNAASATIQFTGFSIHPGSAKNKMINAARVACEFQSLLPVEQTPEHTEGKEGFIHLIHMEGATESATLSYIIRDHDRTLLEKKKEILKKCVTFINDRYGSEIATMQIQDAYHNMKEVIDQNPEVLHIAQQAMETLGIDPIREPIRGGTDGAELSFRGLPCPNLGNGGGNFHGPYEYCVVEELEQACEVILKMIEIIAA